MKKLFLLAMLALITNYSCKNGVKEKTGKGKNSENDEAKIEPENRKSEFASKNFRYLFEYKDAESTQMLGLNVLENEKLQFHLVSKTLPCDTEFWGYAEKKVYSNDATKTLGKEYYKEEVEYHLEILWSPDSSTVVIKYFQKDEEGTDCFPITDSIMNRIK